jgi:hypothetical protein
MFKKTKNFLVLALLAAAAIMCAPQARAGQETLGETVEACVHLQACNAQVCDAQEHDGQECAVSAVLERVESAEQVGVAGDQKENEGDAQQDSGTLEFENGWQVLKAAGINLGILAAVSLSVLVVPHELGHAFAVSTLFPGGLKSVTFLPERRTSVSGESSWKGGHFWCNEKAKPDSAGATFAYKTKWSLVCLAGPVAGMVAGNMVGKLSKHKKCPQVLKWPLRAASCVLPVVQMANLMPMPSYDGGQIYEQWAGGCELTAANKAARLGVVLASMGLMCGLAHKEFPQFFKQINESWED